MKSGDSISLRFQLSKGEDVCSKRDYFEAICGVFFLSKWHRIQLPWCSTRQDQVTLLAFKEA